VAGSFLPADTQVFSVRTSERPAETLRTKKAAPARFRLIVLTGQRTAGPVEALAASLRAQSGATILGVSTQGQAADFEVIPLGKEAFLRLPVREAIVPGAPGLVPDGLHPDIICSATPEATDAALSRASQEGRVGLLLKQTERPRLNEAALVAGENPETEAWIQAQLRRGKPQPEPMPRDAALTMAMDFLMAWESLYGKTQVLP
jgi:C-terminal processing protease CtpA/Prc